LKDKYDYIIIGQGLAGTTLAHIFLQQGQSVLVIDEQKEITSSKVAAGMWNPVVFKRYTQSFLAKTLLQYNAVFFPRVEAVVSAKFYHPRPYYRIFPSEDDVQHWQGKLENSEVKDFLNPSIYNGLNKEYYNAGRGAAVINHCGFLDIKKYIHATANYLSQKNSFLPDSFIFKDLELTSDGIVYKQFTAKKIIFCEGLQTLQNPYWKEVATFYPVKGELLTIKADLPEKEAIINKGIFIVPIGENLYNVGSTYNWSDIDYTPTKMGRTILEGKIKEILKVPYEIVGHKAAIRPSARDRRPFVGLHPNYPQVGILNGLGAKGVMLAPYFAHQLVGNIINGGKIHQEVDIARCFAK